MQTRSLSRGALFVTAATVLLSFALPANAQSPNYIFSAPNAFIDPAATSTLTVSLDNSNGAPVQGFSFGVCTDASIVSVASASIGTDMQTVNNGLPADFAQIDLQTGGVTIGLVVSLPGLNTMAPMANWSILDIDYTAIGNVGDISPMTICGTLGAPTVGLAVVAQGGSIFPTTIDGTIEIALPALVNFSLDTPDLGIPNLPVDATVLLSTAIPVEGFTFGLTYDATQLAFAGATATGALAATNNNTGPDFLDIDTFPGGGIGATFECIITTAGAQDEIPVGDDQPMMSLDFDVTFGAGPPCSVAAIGFSDALGMPPVPLEATVPGGTEVAAGIGGGIEIGVAPVAPPTGGITLIADTVQVDPGDPATARVTLDNDVPIEAISFGLEYNAADVVLSSINIGSTLANLRCGLGPDFYSADAISIGGVGVTVAALFGISPPLAGSTLQPGSDQEIVVLNFVTNPAPSQGGTTLEFTNLLGGTLPVAIEVTIGGFAVLPTTVDGAIVLGPGDDNFVRGNCNGDLQVDLADAIFLLGALFPGQGVALVPDCHDACDANDDGGEDVADAIAILGSLFGAFGPLPAPETCDSDPTADSLDCVSQPNCP